MYKFLTFFHLWKRCSFHNSIFYCQAKQIFFRFKFQNQQLIEIIHFYIEYYDYRYEHIPFIRFLYFYYQIFQYRYIFIENEGKKPPYSWKLWENDDCKGKELYFYGHSSCLVGDRIVIFGGIIIFAFYY